MTTLIKIAIALVLSLFMSSCAFDLKLGPGEKGNGNVVKDSRAVSDDFTEISASEGLEVYVTQGSEYHIEVEADENIIDHIATDVRNHKLRIHTNEKIGRATKKIYVTLPEITNLETSSGANLTVDNTVEAHELHLSASSGAHMELRVDAQSLEAETSSGAGIKVSGETDALDAEVSSGAGLDADALETHRCEANASSGGNMTLNVSDELHAEASSGGNIRYKGNPNVRTSKSVSGSVSSY